MPLIKPSIFDSGKWKTLKSSESVTLLVLIIRANRDTMNAFPGIKKIAEDTRLSSATVRRAIKKLEAKKCIVVCRKITHEKKNDRCRIIKHNSYDLSKWKRFCAKKKD